MLALALLSAIGSKAFLASCPYACASSRAFSTAPESRRRDRTRRTSASCFRRLRTSRSSARTSMAFPSLRADRHQGHIPLPHVRARRLAEARRVAHDVQDVIDDLEGHAEVDPVVPDGLDVLQPCVRQEACDPRSRGHGEGRLPLDDIEVLAPRHPGVVGVALLADLAFGEGGADVRRDLDDVVIEPAADPESLDEEEVPGHERILEAEFLICGEAPAAHVPAVIDVVVNQRRGMDQLERRGKVYGLSDFRPAEGAEGEQRDHGPDPLAPGFDHIAGNVVEKGFFGPDALPDPGFDQGQFTSHAKVERTHDPGRPIASYRLALYNYFQRT